MQYQSELKAYEMYEQMDGLLDGWEVKSRTGLDTAAEDALREGGACVRVWQHFVGLQVPDHFLYIGQRACRDMIITVWASLLSALLSRWFHRS
jgi:hypothetical protein